MLKNYLTELLQGFIADKITVLKLHISELVKKYLLKIIERLTVEYNKLSKLQKTLFAFL
jgi:hypothetical protein